MDLPSEKETKDHFLAVRNDELGEISLENTYGHTKTSTEVRLIAVTEVTY